MIIIKISLLVINNISKIRQNKNNLIYAQTVSVLLYCLLFTILRPCGTRESIRRKVDHGGQIVLWYWQHATNYNVQFLQQLIEDRRKVKGLLDLLPGLKICWPLYPIACHFLDISLRQWIFVLRQWMGSWSMDPCHLSTTQVCCNQKTRYRGDWGR